MRSVLDDLGAGKAGFQRKGTWLKGPRSGFLYSYLLFARRGGGHWNYVARISLYAYHCHPCTIAEPGWHSISLKRRCDSLSCIQ
jgi:hypothetical protein